jgi:hypothetical protein
MARKARSLRRDTQRSRDSEYALKDVIPKDGVQVSHAGVPEMPRARRHFPLYEKYLTLKPSISCERLDH